MKDIIIPVKAGGLTFKNPFFVASGPTTKTVRQLERIEQTGWAAASIKLSIDPAPYINRKPRYALFPEYSALAFTTEKRLTFEEGLRLIAESKKVLSELLLMANITYAGDAGIPGWVNMAKKFEDVGADIIELNMCCPNMSYNVELTSGGSKCAAKQTGASLGQQADVVAAIVAAIKKEIDIPLFVKLTPEGGQIAHVAKALYDAGADAVGTTANRLGIPPIDIDEPEKAIYHLQDEISMSCYCGEWLKPLSQRDVYEIRKVCGMQPAVTGAGGVRNWHDAVELIMAGANLVGVCAETLISGYDIVRPMVAGLKNFMDEHKYKSINDFCGVIVPEVKTAPEVTLYSGYAKIKEQPLYGPCKSVCPLHLPAQGFVQMVAKGKDEDAYRLLTDVSPLSAVCSRVCESPCELACTRGRAGRPVRIREIERYITAAAREKGYAPSFKAGESCGKKAAVAGAGPAGLSAAAELVKLGFDVTVFEREKVAGGSLRKLPAYKIDASDIDDAEKQLRDAGVCFEFGSSYGCDVSADSLRKDGFAAVVVATGCGEKLSENNIEGVWDAGEYVAAAVAGSAPKAKNMLVVGNSEQAADAARCALRFGCEKVVLACGARPCEGAKAATAEGAKLLEDEFESFISEDERLSGARFVQKQLGARYAADFDCAAVVTARAATAAEEGVFSAGAAAGESDMIHTLASGLKAARAAASAAGVAVPDETFATVKAADVLKRSGWLGEDTPRADNVLTPPAQRRDFAGYTRVLSDSEARAEAARCLNCGCSEGCQLCKTICTDFAPYVAGCDRMAIDEKECVACGMCFNRCPNKNIEMINTGKKV